MRGHNTKSRVFSRFERQRKALQNSVSSHRRPMHKDHLKPAHRLWGYLPNPMTYATKIEAKGTGRFFLIEIRAISTTTPKRWGL